MLLQACQSSFLYIRPQNHAGLEWSRGGKRGCGAPGDGFGFCSSHGTIFSPSSEPIFHDCIVQCYPLCPKASFHFPHAEFCCAWAALPILLSPGAGLGSEGSLGMPPSPASPSPTAPQKPQCSLSPADSSSPRSPLFLACLQRSAHACLALHNRAGLCASARRPHKAGALPAEEMSIREHQAIYKTCLHPARGPWKQPYLLLLLESSPLGFIRTRGVSCFCCCRNPFFFLSPFCQHKREHNMFRNSALQPHQLFWGLVGGCGKQS